MRMDIKRVYDPPGPGDGQRILVDRLWPRGLRREQARLNAWVRELAPSDELRRWYGHDPGRWEEFERRYRSELARPERQAALDDLIERARGGRLTLLCAARDVEHGNAAVLLGVPRHRLRIAGR